MAGRFVQNQDARVFQHDSRDSHSLFLAAAQAITALADNGIVAFAQSHDEIVNVRHSVRLPRFLLAKHRVWHIADWCELCRGTSRSLA